MSTTETTGAALVAECEMRAGLKPPVAIGPGPFGTRMYFEVTGGEVTGDRIAGTVLTGGGDWALIGPDGVARLDVRAQVQTHDGAVILLQYHGVLEMNDAVQRALAEGGSTSFADQYFRTNPRMECGDERYAWVNSTLFVGEGRIAEGGVHYRISRIT